MYFNSVQSIIRDEFETLSDEEKKSVPHLRKVLDTSLVSAKRKLALPKAKKALKKRLNKVTKKSIRSKGARKP